MHSRFLVGPLAALGTDRLCWPGQAGSCLTFGGVGADLTITPQDSWDSLCTRLPPAWRPDLVLLSLPTTPVPHCLWSAPVPLVALVRDWDLYWHYLRLVLPHCDLFLTDPVGTGLFAREGLTHALPSVLGAWDQARPNLPRTAGPRDIDLLFLGSLHPARERPVLPWLGRLSRLAGRWRVLVQSGADTDTCRPLLTRARILFTHSRCGAPTPWALAGAAAGALVFAAGPGEVPPGFRDRQECVFYTETSLEPLLEHYLTQEQQRHHIAEAAQARVRHLDSDALWDEVLGAIDQNRPALQARAAVRPAWGLREELLARAWLAGAESGQAEEPRAADLPGGPQGAPLHNALGVAVPLPPQGPERDRAALSAAEHFRQALACDPRHVLAGLNRAEALAVAGESQAAIDQARSTLATLDQVNALRPEVLLAPHFPPGFDHFRAERERAAWRHAGDPEAEGRTKRDLLVWRLHGLLARLTGELCQRYEAALARPDLPSTRATLGSALLQTGRVSEAVSHLRRAVAGNPFDIPAARALFQALAALGRRADQDQLIQERRLLCRAAPGLVPVEPWFAQDQEPSAAPAPLAVPPGPQLRVSLCLIVRDEEHNLPDCLASVADLVDEIIVIDTGSADRTREVAARFGARVFDFVWQDSFAAARNESLRQARGEWIFWLDADEHLDEENREQLRQLLDHLPSEDVAYLMGQHSRTDANSPDLVVEQARLFRHDPLLRWEYRVHEQILPALLRRGARAQRTGVVIRHRGYQDPALRRRKVERNLKLLRLEDAEHPGDPFTLFNLGSVYLELGRLAEAAGLLRRSLERSPPGYNLTPRTCALLVHTLRQLGQTQEATALCQEARARFPENAELLSQHRCLQQREA